ncbi:MAG: CHRD domain-containing protein, partial [Halioglobus sp.]|nr:CHRD domain-containing protein [Halioglobus sp.]
EASLDGAQANAGAGTGSPGTGSATMTLDDTSNLFSWDISWAGLLTPVFIGHFHGPALPTQNAGVQVSLGPVSGASGSTMGSAVISDLQAADLLGGLWYINLHTATWPGGEIRGQVLVSQDPPGVPAPGILALLGLGLAGIGLSRRRSH